MNRGKILGAVLYICLMAFGFGFYYIALLLPEIAQLFLPCALLSINGAGFFLLWGFTKEGSVWMARRVGGQNLAIDVFIEKSNFADWIVINLSQPHTTIKKNDYLLNKDRIIFRRGGIPYVFHLDNEIVPVELKKKYIDEKGQEKEVIEAVDMQRTKSFVSATEATQFIKERVDLLLDLLMDQERRRNLLLLIIIMALVILTAAFFFFGPVQEIQDKLNWLIQFAVQARSQLMPSPSPGAIPSA